MSVHLCISCHTSRLFLSSLYSRSAASASCPANRLYLTRGDSSVFSQPLVLTCIWPHGSSARGCVRLLTSFPPPAYPFHALLSGLVISSRTLFPASPPCHPPCRLDAEKDLPGCPLLPAVVVKPVPESKLATAPSEPEAAVPPPPASDEGSKPPTTTTDEEPAAPAAATAGVPVSAEAAAMDTDDKAPAEEEPAAATATAAAAAAAAAIAEQAPASVAAAVVVVAVQEKEPSEASEAVAVVDEGNLSESLGRLDLLLTYLWRVHGIDYYAGYELTAAEFGQRLTGTR